MVTPKSASRGGKFFASNSITVGNGASTCSDPCAPGGDYSTIIGNSSWDNAYTSDPSSRGKRLDREPSTLVQHTQRTGGSLDG
jgi:hypothetical protein